MGSHADAVVIEGYGDAAERHFPDLILAVRSQWDDSLYDAKAPCRLMALAVFSLAKCREYSRTGGSFCSVCASRPRLRALGEVREG